MSEEKYCGLQIDYGEAFLCDTCKTYPRSYIEINNMLELWLSRSCPEVARQVLFLEGGIKLENMTFDMDESILTSSYLKSIMDLLRKNEMNSMGHMVSLVNI